MTGDPLEAVQSDVRWWVDRDGNAYATHEGPCVFVDGACVCGVMDVGIARAAP